MNKKILLVILLIFNLGFMGLRFIHLLADFPAGINWSGDLYTDEGWYSSGAMHKFLSGNWLVPGDFNPILSMPFFQLVQYVVFRLFGISLTAARITSLLFFVLALLSIGLLLRLFRENWETLGVILFLSVDYLTFLYSRLAFLELPMLALVFLSLYLIELGRKNEKIWLLVLSGFVYLLALLTKTTAIFALPVLLFSTAFGWHRSRVNFFRPLLVLSISLLPWAAYTLIIRLLFPADIQYFTRINFQNRLVFEPAAVVMNAKEIFTSSPLITQPAYWAILPLLVSALIINGRIIRDRLFQILSLSLIAYIGMLSFSSYQPPRYFIPAWSLFNILLCLIMIDNLRSWKAKPYQWGTLLIAVALLAWNADHDVRYMAHPQYSFERMLTDVKAKISPNIYRSPIMVGPFANTVSLELGIESVNTFQGTKDLAWKIEQYHPSYYLALGNDQKELEILEGYYNLDRLDDYDVFRNYYDGKQVVLYHLNSR